MSTLIVIIGIIALILVSAFITSYRCEVKVDNSTRQFPDMAEYLNLKPRIEAIIEDYDLDEMIEDMITALKITNPPIDPHKIAQARLAESTSKYHVGEHLRVIACQWGHQLEIGDVVEVLDVDYDKYGALDVMYICFPLGDPSDVWFLGDDEVEPAHPTTPMSQVPVIPTM
jgi:hypothetical protein